MSDSIQADDGFEQVMALFIDGRDQLERMLAPLCEDPLQVLDAAQQIFAQILRDCAYTDAPNSAFARALFYCNIHLSLYLALEGEVDVHEFGLAMLADLAATTPKFEAAKAGPVTMDISSPGTHPGEFQVELVQVEGSKLAWGYNITSCAICHQFAKYDAHELVPYMCASDDVVSDAGNQGLRRSGTIALGAHHCDFRYDPHAQPQHIASLHPERIRLVDK